MEFFEKAISLLVKLGNITGKKNIQHSTAGNGFISAGEIKARAYISCFLMSVNPIRPPPPVHNTVLRSGSMYCPT